MKTPGPIPNDGPYISLIIPAFNEEGRIGKSLERILDFFRSGPHSYELIVVDDGSQDRTVEIARQIAPEKNVHVIQKGKNSGKGAAIQSGMIRARGKYTIFSDADLSVPIETLPLLVSELENGCDVAIGSRQKTGAVIEIHQSPYREFMGKVYTKLANRILGLRISDFTCGFKGFRGEVARDLFSRQRVFGWSFDAEILYLAKRKNYSVVEIPVRWRDDRRTKVKLWRDVFTSFFELLKIRLCNRNLTKQR